MRLFFHYKVTFSIIKYFFHYKVISFATSGEPNDGICSMNRCKEKNETPASVWCYCIYFLNFCKIVVLKNRPRKLYHLDYQIMCFCCKQKKLNVLFVKNENKVIFFVKGDVWGPFFSKCHCYQGRDVLFTLFDTSFVPH